MLRGEAKWFPRFLDLYKERLACLKREDLEDNILIPLLESIIIRMLCGQPVFLFFKIKEIVNEA